MALDELVYQYLTEQESLASILTSFDSHPAVFYRQAPDDKDRGWGEDKIQYPRMEFLVSMQANAERKSAGILQFTILCSNTGIEPEDIEPLLRDELKDLLICTDGNKSYATAWARTETFTTQQYVDDVDVKVLGMDIFFDILEFAVQETTNPDPVMALNSFIKDKIPNSTVLGWDKVEKYLKPNAKMPVFYCHLQSIEKERVTNTVAWMQCRISVHVLCPDSEQRLKLIAYLTNILSLDEEVTMLDYSPMRIRNLQMDNMADYLTQGQISITGNYGVLRYFEKGKNNKIIILDKQEV